MWWLRLKICFWLVVDVGANIAELLAKLETRWLRLNI